MKSKEKIKEIQEERKKKEEKIYNKEQKEIYRIKAVARIYNDLQVYLPEFRSDYLDTYLEIAGNFFFCIVSKD